jgi:adenylosuccinate lyase
MVNIVERLEDNPTRFFDKGWTKELIEEFKEEILHILNPDHLCGRAKNQVTDFIEECVNPVLEKYKDLINEEKVEINV